MNWVRIGLIGLLIVCPIVILGFEIRAQNWLRATGVRTLGTVKDIEKDETSDSGNMYCLLVQFTAQNGRSYCGRNSWGSSKPKQQVGDQVVIAYDASKPESFRLESELSAGGNYLRLWLWLAVVAYFLWNN